MFMLLILPLAVPTFYEVAQWQADSILFVAEFVPNLNFTDALFGDGAGYQEYFRQVYNTTYGGIVILLPKGEILSE